MKNVAPAAYTSGQGPGDTKPTANTCAAQAKQAEKLFKKTSQKVVQLNAKHRAMKAQKQQCSTTAK